MCKGYWKVLINAIASCDPAKYKYNCPTASRTIILILGRIAGSWNHNINPYVPSKSVTTKWKVRCRRLSVWKWRPTSAKFWLFPMRCQHHLTCRPIDAASKCQRKYPPYRDTEGCDAQNEGRAERKTWAVFKLIQYSHISWFGVPALSVIIHHPPLLLETNMIMHHRKP